MSFSKKQDLDRVQGPNTILALRESLIQDSQLGRFERRVESRDTVQQDWSNYKDQISPLNSNMAALTENAPQQAKFFAEGLASDSPTIAPVDSTGSSSPQSTLHDDRTTNDSLYIALSNDAECVKENSPTGILVEQSRYLADGQPNAQSEGTTGDLSLKKKRIWRVVGHSLLAIAIIAAAFGLLSYENDFKKDIVQARELSLRWMSSALGTNTAPAPDAKPVTASSQATEQDTNIKPPASPMPAAPSPAVLSPEQSHELDTIVDHVRAIQRLVEGLTTQQAQTARGLATLQHRAEDLAVRQDQLARDIATLQETETSFGRRIELLQPQKSTRYRPQKHPIRKVGISPFN